MNLLSVAKTLVAEVASRQHDQRSDKGAGNVKQVATVIGFVLLSLQPVCADEAAATRPFVLSSKLIEQSRQAANAQGARPRDLKQRRPRGLEQLQTPDEIKRAVNRAFGQLSSTNREESDLAFAQLHYLGDHAFSQIAAGANSPDESVAISSLMLLGGRGSRAREILEGRLQSPSKRVAAAAIKGLIDIQDPGAIPALIEALNNETIRYDVVSALVRFHDPRAITPLMRWEETYRQELKWLQEEQHPALRMFPVDRLPQRQFCREAACLDGENYGPEHVGKLIELLDLRFSQDLAADGARALLQLGDPSAVPAVIRAITTFRQADDEIMQGLRTGSPGNAIEVSSRLNKIRATTSTLFEILAQVPTEQGFDFLLQGVQSSNRSLRASTIETLSHVRWGIPVLIGLLDDPQFLGEQHQVSGKYAEKFWKLDMPATHEIYDKLCLSFGRFGLTAREVRMTSAQTGDLARNFSHRR